MHKITRYRRACLLIAAAAACGALGSADAHEADWLYFPMYERDTAHAVHLPALKLREDGLLEAATRYPRHSEAQWTAEENAAGWYEYVRRLIDCETGFSVELEERLLDRQGHSIAVRVAPASEWLEQLRSQLRSVSSRRWPDTGEFTLACVAASHLTLRDDRARRAQTPAPVVATTPTIRALIAETSQLIRIAMQPMDLEAASAAGPQTSEQLFALLQAQYVAWRRSLNRSLVLEPETEESLVRIRKQIATGLQSEGAAEIAFRVLSSYEVESLEDWQRLYDEPPREAHGAVAQASLVRTDCRAGLAVTLATVWLDERSEPLHTVPMPVTEAIAELRTRYPNDASNEPPNLLSTEPLALRPCQALAKIRQDTGETATSFDRITITAAQLEAAKTPEQMLLLIRSAR